MFPNSLCKKAKPGHAPLSSGMIQRDVQENPEVVLDALLQNLQVIAAFQHRDQPASGAFLGQIQHQASHLPVAAPGQVHLGQGILGVSVEARGNHHELRGELPQAGQPLVPQGLQIFLVAAVGRKGQVQGEAFTRTLALLPAVTGAGVAVLRVLVQRQVKDPGVGLEEMLGAVPWCTSQSTMATRSRPKFSRR